MGLLPREQEEGETMNRKPNFLNVFFTITVITAVISSIAPMPVNASGQEAWPLYHELVIDDARGWIYGSDSAGKKIDVIRISDLGLEKSINIPNSAPKGIALSPDGSELAVANYGIGGKWDPAKGSILFFNPVTGLQTNKIVPNLSGYDGNYNRPWDLVYGRAGRLYSTGSPNSSAYDFIHIIDTTIHKEIGRSSFFVRMEPSLAISQDKTKLYYFESDQSPKKLYSLDITTDTLPADPESSPHVDWLLGSQFVLSPDESKLFINSGQVWSADLRGQIGSFGFPGNIALLPDHGALAVLEDKPGNDVVRFFDTDDFYGIKTYNLSSLGTIGPMAVSSDESKLFISSESGITVVDLSSGLPGSTIGKPAGSLPYADLEVDSSRSWLYGADSAGHKIDVISMSTLAVVKKYRLVNGSSPVDIELSPDGTELAIAEYGASSLVFINPDNGHEIAKTMPSLGSLNKPWRIAYGRTGRLYSVGNPNSYGIDYIHVFDTESHTEVGISLYPDTVRTCPELKISSDNSKLYVHETCQSPQKIYEYDISTDTPAQLKSTPHSSSLRGMNFVISNDDKIFIDSGQVLDPGLRGIIGSTGQSGYLALLPTHNAIAVGVDRAASDSVKFFSVNDYYGITTYNLPFTGVLGPMAALPSGNRLFISTNVGVIAVNLSSGLPGTPIGKPQGSQPYFDLVIDEARGVLYGSDPAGHKIDVVNMSTLAVIKKFRLANGSTPTNIALSPDGSELAVAAYGASSIVFLNPTNGNTIASLLPDVDSMNLPWDVIYGRAGRLYSTGAPTSYGHDYIHVIDTATHTEVGRSGFDWYPRNHPSLAISSDGNTLYVEESFPSSLILSKCDISTDVPSRQTYLNLGVTGQKATILLLDNQSKIISSAGQIVDSNVQNILGIFTAVGNLAEIPSHHSFVSANKNNLNFYDTNTHQKIGFFTLSDVKLAGPMAVPSDDSQVFVSTDAGIKPVSLADFPPVNPISSPVVLQSVAAHDGWILESGENTSIGGSSNKYEDLTVGDYHENKQYVSILSFNTAFLLPHSATITKVTLQVKKSAQANNPFSSLSYLTADIREGAFGGLALALSDFQAIPSRADIGRFSPVSGSPDWYQLVMKPVAFRYLNKVGPTQFKLRFIKDDDNDKTADYITFYSGDTNTVENRPILIIEFTVP